MKDIPMLKDKDWEKILKTSQQRKVKAVLQSCQNKQFSRKIGIIYKGSTQNKNQWSINYQKVFYLISKQQSVK